MLTIYPSDIALVNGEISSMKRQSAGGVDIVLSQLSATILSG